METEKIEQEYMYYKTALAIALIRMKPEGISLDHFVQCFQANFRKDYKSNREQINELKEVILQTKQELFMLKNKELIMQAEENYLQNESKNIKVKNDTDKEKEFQIDYELKYKLSKQYELNILVENFCIKFYVN